MKKQTKLGLVLAAAAVISVSVASLVSARGWVQNGADWYYVDNNGEYVTDTIQSSGNAKFYLGEDGAMMRDYFLEEYGDSNNAYYFGQNGAMVTNTWVAIESSRVENQEDYVPDNYWYYFQASGKAMKAGSGAIKKTTIDGKKYAFNEHGQMLTGWVDGSGKVINPDDETNPFAQALYYAGGDNDGVLRSGWVTYYDGYDGDGTEAESEYTNLYFYFNTSNCKMYGKEADGSAKPETKKINGKTYAFSGEGVMLSGWDAWERRVGMEAAAEAKYFSGEDDGHQVKKGWVYAVPAYDIDSKKYNDDEEQYMYFAASGDIVKDQFKKVNGKFYAFNRTGLMKSGVIIWCQDGTTAGAPAGTTYKYVDKLDLDYAEGSDVSKKGKLVTGDKASDVIYVDYEGRVITGNGKANTNDKVKLHLYGSDGARKTGANNVEFADDTYVLQTSGNLGDKGSGYFGKKYYSLGIQVKASPDLRYGIFTMATPTDVNDRTSRGGKLHPQATTDNMSTWYGELNRGSYQVLTTGGSKVKANQNGKKDADGNYWLIGQGDALKGIWTQNVSYGKSFNTTWRTRKIQIPNDEGTAAGKASISLAELAQYYGLAVVGANPELELAGADEIRWRPNRNATERSIYFTPNKQIKNVYSFQSDYDGGSNKWIPMGLTDDSGKTCRIPSVAAAGGCDDPSCKSYEVKPTDDYFLNCYWIYKD